MGLIPTGCRVRPPNGSAGGRVRTTVRRRGVTRSRACRSGRSRQPSRVRRGPPAAHPDRTVPRAAGGAPVSATGAEVIGVDEADRADRARSARRDAELNRLAGLASHGDQRALELLLSLIRPTVVQYCRARIGLGMLGTQSAEDIA